MELAELTPDSEAYLGQLGYLTLVMFENLGRAAAVSPTMSGKSRVGRVAAGTLDVHERVLAELRALKLDPAAAMEPYRSGLDDFQRRTQGDDWYETLISCYLTSGFLLDFFVRLAPGLPDKLAKRMAEILRPEGEDHPLVDELRESIDRTPQIASRLAMWGRRLIGDTMLIARSTLNLESQSDGKERVEPVFTELIAAHTRRMDGLGLTA